MYLTYWLLTLTDNFTKLILRVLFNSNFKATLVKNFNSEISNESNFAYFKKFFKISNKKNFAFVYFFLIKEQNLNKFFLLNIFFFFKILEFKNLNFKNVNYHSLNTTRTTSNFYHFLFKFNEKNKQLHQNWSYLNFFKNIKFFKNKNLNFNQKINLIKFSVSDFFKYLNNYSINKINVLFLRKNKVFNKGRYSRNRQYYRTGVYWCLYVNIVAVIGIYFWFYRFNINFGYLWWLLYFFFFTLFFSRSISLNVFGLKKTFVQIYKSFLWFFNIINSFFLNFFKLLNFFFREHS